MSTPDDRLQRRIHQRWQRGQPSDLRAIRALLERHPEARPPFLLGPLGCVLCVAPDRADAHAVATMLAGQYWTTGMSHARMAAAQLGSTAWIVAREAETGEVVASARAISDRARFGHILDVIVQPSLRGRGLGRALMTLLLDHPALRELLVIGLRTRDAHTLYREFGFVDAPDAGTAMALVRREPSPALATRPVTQ